MNNIKVKQIVSLLLVAFFVTSLLVPLSNFNYPATAEYSLVTQPQITKKTTTFSSPVSTLSSSQRPIVVFDEGHNQYYDHMKLYDFLNIVRERADVVINTDNITASDLENASVLIIPNPGRDFNDTEIKAIKDFVKNGGSLLIMGDWYNYYTVNLTKITGDFGIIFYDSEILDENNHRWINNYEPIIHVFNNESEHSRFMTEGISEVVFNGGTLNVTGNAFAIGIGDNDPSPNNTYAVDESSNVIANGSNVIAFAGVDLLTGGRIFASGSSKVFANDSSAWYRDYIHMYDNEKFARAVVEWLFEEFTTIVFDESHDQYFNSARCSQFIDYLRSHKENVIINTEPITKGLLSAADILVIFSIGTHLTTDEIDAITWFIENQSGAVLFAANREYYWGNNSDYNEITAQFGITFLKSTIYDENNNTGLSRYPYLRVFANNSLAQLLSDNVSVVQYEGGALDVNEAKGAVKILLGDEDPSPNNTYAMQGSTILANGTNVIAAAANDLADGGRIFAIGSSRAFGDAYGYFDTNKQFIANVMGWLEGELLHKSAALYLEASAPEELPMRDNGTLAISLTNLGGINATNVNLTVTMPSELVTSNDTFYVIGDLEPGATKTFNIIFNSTVPGSYSIEISVVSTLGGNITKVLKVIIIPDIALTLKAEPSIVLLSERQTFNITAKIENIATLTVHDIVAQISLPAENITTTDNVTAEIGTLNASMYASVTWHFSVSGAGDYKFTVTVSSSDGGEVSETIVVKALAHKVIVFDNAHGQYFDPDRLSDFIAMLGEYYEVVINTDPITSDILAAAEIYVLPNPESEIKDSEASALKSFVNNGGKLLITGNWYNYFYPDYVNKITEDWGIYWYDADIEDPTNNIQGNAYWPVLYTWANNTVADRLKIGVTEVYYDGTGLMVSGNAVPVLLGDDDAYVRLDNGTVISWENGSVVGVAAYSNNNGGKVLAYGSSYIVRSDGSYASWWDINKVFVRNSIEWLLGISPTPHLTASFVIPGSATAGETFTIQVKVTNDGSGTATNVVVTLSLPDGVSLSPENQSLEVTLGDIAPGESKYANWTVVAETPGTYSFNASISADNYDTFQIQSTSITIEAPGPAYDLTTIGIAVAGIVIVVVIIVIIVKKRK